MIFRARSALTRLSRPLILSSALVALLTAAVVAQVPGGGWGGMLQAGWAGGHHQREMLPSERQGFYGCWLIFDRWRTSWGKRGWDTDYPLAVRHFMQRLGEFTTTPINTYSDGAMADGAVRATDPEIFMCPFLFTSDIGTASFSDVEIEQLREYLLKGGFLWADDSWGREAMDAWMAQVARILPGYERIVLDKDHPMMSSFYFLDEAPQMPSFQSWRRSGGMYEQRGTDSSEAELSAIVDEHGRALIVMSHNTDIGDGMEREGVDPVYFELFSPHAYATSINIALYSMTH
jgi:hypothetical protein